jgi:hypothetical protein
MMNLLHEPPPGFDGVSKAFAMAKQLPTTQRLGVKVGLTRDSTLIAMGELDGYRQVTFFSEHMRDMGYQERLLGGDDEMHGCDMLFALPAQPIAVDSDPSFIRRPAVQLWPVRS